MSVKISDVSVSIYRVTDYKNKSNSQKGIYITFKMDGLDISEDGQGFMISKEKSRYEGLIKKAIENWVIENEPETKK